MWGQLIGAGLNIGASIYGGIKGAKAANAAANIQAGQAGENAESAGQLPYKLNPYLQQSAEQWSGNVRGVYDEAGNLVMDTANQAGTNIRGAAQQANTLLDPYNAAGGESTQTLLDMARRGLEAGPEKFQFSEDDPSYKWRLQQGQQALERGAAARGQLTGGGTMKALARYGQGAASQEYQAAFDRFMAGQKQGLEEKRFYGDTLGGLATRGLAAGTRMGDNTIGAERLAGDWATQGANQAGQFRGRGAEYQSGMMNDSTKQQVGNIFAGEAERRGYLTDRATALAGGQVASANAFTQGISNAAGAAGGLLTLGDITNWGKAPAGGGGGVPAVPYGLPSARPAQNLAMSQWYLPQPGQTTNWGW